MSADPTEGIKDTLTSLEPYEFEQFVAELWERRGWSTEVTSQSQDAGIDVIARQSNPFEQTQIIQAKRYKSGNKVGSSNVQQYASLKQQVPDADMVIVVTTSDFTSGARQRAEELNVKLISGTDILRIIDSEDAYDLVERYTNQNVGEQSSESEYAGKSVQIDDGDDLEEDMSTFEAMGAVVQGLLALAVVLFILFMIAQVLLF